MKKIVSAFIAFALAIQFVPCAMPAVYAETAENAVVTELTSKVLAHIKTRIGDTSKYDLFESDYSTSEEDNKIYYIFSFDWRNSQTNDELLVCFWLTDKNDIENKGYITEYTKYESHNSTADNHIKMSDQIADIDKYIKTAQSFTDSINPNMKGQFVVSMPHLSDPTSLSVERYENSIPVSDQYGELKLSDDGSEVISFYLYDYDPDNIFPAADSIISKKEAPAAYKKAVPLNLKYFSRYNIETEKREIYTAYTPDFSKGKYINAVTGEPFKASEPQNIMTTAAKSAANGGGSAEDAEYDLSEAEKGEIENMEGILTKEKVDSIIKSNKNFSLNDYIMTRFSAYKYGSNNEKRINCYYTGTDDNRVCYADFVLDAETGEIKYFSKSYESSDYIDESTIYKDFAYLTSKAETVAKSLASDKYEEYKLAAISEDVPILYSNTESNDYYGHLQYTDFNFIRYVNGIPFDKDKISLTLDPVTGELLTYSIAYFAPPSDFPAANAKLSASDAYDRIFSSSAYKLELSYISVPTTDENARGYLPAYYLTGKSNNYYFNANIRIDANTGKSLYPDGREIKDAVTGEYTDISDSPYKNEIIALASLEKGFEGTKFEPKKEITHAELKKLINYSDDQYKYNDEKIVTKSELAYIISSDIVNKKLLSADIYKEVYSDVTDNKGSVAIAVLYGFLAADRDKFEPEKAVTREEAAHAAYLIYTKEYE